MHFHFISSENPEAKQAQNNLIKRYNQSDINNCDVIIAIGGDGMLLKALRYSIDLNVPVFGLNKGNVGFLMNELSINGLDERVKNANKVNMYPLKMKARKLNGKILRKLL